MGIWFNKHEYRKLPTSAKRLIFNPDSCKIATSTNAQDAMTEIDNEVSSINETLEKKATILASGSTSISFTTNPVSKTVTFDDVGTADYFVLLCNQGGNVYWNIINQADNKTSSSFVLTSQALNNDGNLHAADGTSRYIWYMLIAQ